MATSLTEVFNLALSACGSRALLTDSEENSREAALCRLWLPKTRDFVLQTAPWPCARAYSRLARTAERDTADWAGSVPTPARHYAYAAPADLLHPIHLQSFGRFEYLSGEIHCDEDAPILFYNRRVEDVGSWDPQFVEALIHTLASRIARNLTGKSAIVQEQFDIARMQAESMAATVGNMDGSPLETVPDWMSVRGFGGPAAFHRYYYPFVTFNAETSS